jgi:class 3 adenylate cyclase/tetratricopeptide (TPR) repeat protein
VDWVVAETISTQPAADAAGIRTFFIADVRGYTRFTVEHGDAAAARLASKFAALANQVVGHHGGEVIELRGDEALAVFSSARQALRAATELQSRVAEESAAEPDLAMKIGIGLDAGEAVPVQGGFRGAALNLAARLCSLAGAGEVLSSDTVVSLARKLDGIEYQERGTVPLKGFTDPVRVVQVAPHGGPHVTPEVERVADVPLPIGGFLGALPAGPLVARSTELERLLVPLDAAAAGTGRLVMLAGEPGAGKTRLAQEVTLAARNRDFIVAAGSCYEARESVPYYPFLDALASLYGAAPATLRSSVALKWPQLARLLPEAGIGPAALDSDGQQEQERLFRAVAGFIGALSETAPVALFLDDLHWADMSSLEMLRHVAKHTRSQRVFTLATYRDVEVGRQHPLEEALLDLTREGLVERIPIRRLDEAGTSALIAATFGEHDVSQEFAELVFQRTEGNPFFTQEVLRAMVERGDVFRQGDAWERREVEEIEVPESVRAVIGRRLSRLAQEAQDVLRQASVLGTTFLFDNLHSMGEIGEAEIERALEDGVAAGLIREEGRDRYAFSHALTQQALYAEMPSRRRRRLHLAAGEAIEALTEHKRKERTGELAWHFLEGDDPERALRYTLMAGAEAAKVFAWSEAQKHYRTALELAGELDDRQKTAEASYKLGDALLTMGDLDEALPHLDRAGDNYAALDDVLGEGLAAQRATYALAQKNLRGRVAANRARAQRLYDAIARLEPSREVVEFYSSEIDFLWGHGQLAHALEMSARGLEVARALGEHDLHMRMELKRSEMLGISGHIVEAADTSLRLLSEAEAVGDLQTVYEAVAGAAEWLMLAGRLQESLSYRLRDLELSMSLGLVFQAYFAHCNLAQVYLYLGDWEHARSQAQQGLALGEEHGMGFVARAARLNLGYQALMEGDWIEARRLLQHAADDTSGPLQVGRYAQRGLAQLDLKEGAPSRAAERLRPIIETSDPHDNDIIFLLPVLSQALTATGDAAAGERMARQVLDQSPENALACVDALSSLGLALARQGRHDDAAAPFEAGVRLARPMPYPYAEALALAAWGSEDGSRERLEEALAIFRRLGARKDVEEIERRLAGG